MFAGVLGKLNANEVVPKLESGEKVAVELAGETFEFGKDEVLINISSKEGFDVCMENNIFVILDTNLTPELIEEGYAREFISKVQQLRKSNDFEVLDNIDIKFFGDDEIANAISNFDQYIKNETLALDIERVEDNTLEVFDLNGHDTGIKVIRK